MPDYNNEFEIVQDSGNYFGDITDSSGNLIPGGENRVIGGSNFQLPSSSAGLTPAQLAQLNGAIQGSEKGSINGVANLDSSGKVPASQLPSYVDDILEYGTLAAFPPIGESGKLYIAADTNLIYRWGGSSYGTTSSSLALGETIATAYRGDRGKIAYDHSLIITGNPHNVTKVDLGLSNVNNTSDLNKPISTAVQTALNNTQPLDAGLTTIAALSGAGFVKATATDTFTLVTSLAQSDITNLVADLSGKEPLIGTGLTTDYFRGDKTFQVLDKTAVGLANVDNTSDINKGISTLVAAALSLKAPLISPTFTGTVTAPTGLTPSSVVVKSQLDGKQAKTSLTVGLAGSGADYICDGTADDVEIQQAVDALYVSNKGGFIDLQNGVTFNTAAAIRLYGSTALETPSVTIRGGGMYSTFIKPSSGINAIEMGKATQGNVLNLGFLLAGASTGIQDIDGLITSDGIGWRMRNNQLENLSFAGDATHTGWAMQIQPFRTRIKGINANQYDNANTFGYPANGIKLFATSTPNTGSSFNPGDSTMERFHITVKTGGTALWIDSPLGGDGSYFNQMMFSQGVLRNNGVGTGTGIKIGKTGGDKIQGLHFLGINAEDFNIIFDLYNAQGCIFETYYTQAQGAGAIHMKLQEGSKNNQWRFASKVGIFAFTADVINDTNTDAQNPNIFSNLNIETSGGTASINGSTSIPPLAGTIIHNIFGLQNTGTRHRLFNVTQGIGGNPTFSGGSIKVGDGAGTTTASTNNVYINRADTSNSADFRFSTGGAVTATTDWSLGTRATFGSDIVMRAASTGNMPLRAMPNGNIGLGGDWSLSTPAYKLDVKGDVNILSGSIYRINGLPIPTKILDWSASTVVDINEVRKNGTKGWRSNSIRTTGLIFDTTEQSFWTLIYDSSLSDTTRWSKTGDAGTIAGTNFIGTTDVQDVVIKKNSVEKFRVGSGTPVFPASGDANIIQMTQAGSAENKLLFGNAVVGSKLFMGSDSFDFYWQSGYGNQTQYGAYHGIDISGGRANSTQQAYISGTAGAFNTRLVNSFTTQVGLITLATAGATANIEEWRIGNTTTSTLVASIDPTGKGAFVGGLNSGNGTNGTLQIGDMITSKTGGSFFNTGGTGWTNLSNVLIGVGNITDLALPFKVKSDGATKVVATIQGFTSQTGDLTQWLTSTGIVAAKIAPTGNMSFDTQTNTAGITGTQTINKPSATVNIAAGQSTLIINNNTVQVASIVLGEIKTNDATAQIKNIVTNTGVIFITLVSPATAETKIGFVVFN
jgi:hypothetical protein